MITFFEINLLKILTEPFFFYKLEIYNRFENFTGVFCFLQLHAETNAVIPVADDDQIQKATALVKRVDLKDFSVCQFANPGNPFTLVTVKRF